MELRRRALTAEMIAPDTGELIRTPLEVRIDPLTGHTTRILPDRGLMPVGDFDLAAFARESEPRCPFCPGRLERLTPRIPASIHADGRITRGEAVLFPNLHAYASYSCVSVYSPRLHFLPVAGINERLLADNLATQIAYAQAVMSADPAACWSSINANHMLPSGSSLFHPHLQGIVDPEPTTLQRLLAGVPPPRFDAYLRAERQAGERYLGSTGTIEWVASFAPIAPAEIRAFVAGCCTPVALTGERVAELAHGLALVLAGYAEMGFESFNLAIYGAPPDSAGYPLNLRVAARSNLKPCYRSDSTFLERLHWEGAIDLLPETVAARLGDRFRI